MTTMYTGSVPPNTNNNAGIFATVAAIGAGIGATVFGVGELFDVDYIDAVAQAGEGAATIDMDSPAQAVVNITDQVGGISLKERAATGVKDFGESVREFALRDSILEQNGDLTLAEFKAQLADAVTSYETGNLVTAPELQNVITDPKKVDAITEFLNDGTQQELYLPSDKLNLVKVGNGEAVAVVELEKTALLNEDNVHAFNKVRTGVSSEDMERLRPVSANPFEEMPKALLTGGAVGATGGLGLAGASKLLAPDTKIAEAQYQQALAEGRQLGIN